MYRQIIIGDFKNCLSYNSTHDITSGITTGNLNKNKNIYISKQIFFFAIVNLYVTYKNINLWKQILNHNIL